MQCLYGLGLASSDKGTRKEVTLIRTRVALATASIGSALAMASGGAGADTASRTFQITSSAFANSSAIPTAYTCEGSNVSPPLEWSGAPSSAKTFALIVDDPDAPDPSAPKLTFVHWVVYNLPASAHGLPEGVRRDAFPAGASEGTNDWKKTGYSGPCPPIGRHRYFFKVYALDARLEGLKAPSKADLERAMKDHIVAKAELVGTYEKTAAEKKMQSAPRF